MSYQRKIGDKQRLEKIYTATKHSCRTGVYWDRNKERYIQYWSSHIGSKKMLKRLSNKRYRRSDITVGHNTYRRLFDLWYTLF